MARKNDNIATVQGTFIGERVKDLAVMYLTRRGDLELKWQDPSDEWVDCIVEIKGKEKPARRLFGVELSGTMSPVTDEHANKVLYPKMQSMLRRGKFPFPVCLLYFTMANNEGRFAWVAEPVLESAKPMLRYHEQADTKKFDKGELDKIVEQINNWFDAMDAESGNISCGECGTVLYDEPANLPVAARKPCPRCGSTKRAFSLQATVALNLSAALNARASVIDYPESMLNTASDLIRRELYDAAILMAHQACEIATERAIASALSRSKHQFATYRLFALKRQQSCERAYPQHLYIANWRRYRRTVLLATIQRVCSSSESGGSEQKDRKPVECRGGPNRNSACDDRSFAPRLA